MTKDQKIKRLEARVDFLENWIVQSVLFTMSREEAKTIVKMRCSEFIDSKFSYPLKPEEE